jgi:hypothetical protein
MTADFQFPAILLDGSGAYTLADRDWKNDFPIPLHVGNGPTVHRCRI